MVDVNYVTVLLTHNHYVNALKWCSDNSLMCVVAGDDTIGSSFCGVMHAYREAMLTTILLEIRRTRIFVFSQEDDAILFKLRYG